MLFPGFLEMISKQHWRPLRQLQTRVLAAVGGTFLVLFLGQLGLIRLTIMRDYADLEIQEAETNATRMERSFSQEIENLQTGVWDWGVWDDTYGYIQTRNQAYIDSNFTKETFLSLSIQIVAIFDRNQNLVYGQIFDPETETQRTIPSGLVAALQQQPQLLDRSLENPDLSGFTMLDGTPWLVASQAIVTSTNEGPVRGTFVMGRYFDDAPIAVLAETTQLPIEGFLYGDEHLPADVRTILPVLEHRAEQITVQTLSPDNLGFYALIPDLRGQPGIVLKGVMARDIYHRGQASINFYLWSALSMGIGLCLLIMLLLRRLVTARLNALSQQVGTIGRDTYDDDHDAPEPIQVSLAGQDVLAELANTINWTLQQLHQRTTELKVAKQVADAAREVADQANRAKSAFLANMTHELRTPLNAILGFTQVLGRDRTLTPQQQEKVSIINRSGEHLLALINDVLDMSKIESNHIELNPSPFDLHYLLESLEDMLSLKADSKDLQLVLAAQPEVPQYIFGDSRKLRQTLLNLLNNAIKFTDSGSVQLLVSRLDLAAQVETVGQPVQLQFAVADTGVGIAPEELPLLFQPFSQTEAGRQAHQGTGLGLSISRKFVELMGGELRVNSALGQGSTFTFDIWTKTCDHLVTNSSKSLQLVVGLEPGQPAYRILVVDDRDVNRKLLVELLSPIGFEVREASNGQEAIDQWQSWQPHLIWMDMRMPVMDGYEATQRIKAQLKGQSTAIIALTASTLEEEKAIVLSAGCDDFVRKPFQQTTIFSKIAEYLGTRYCYKTFEDAVPLPRDPQVLDETVLLTNLAAMPCHWLKHLSQAATQLKAWEIRALVAQMPPEASQTRQILIKKVDNFDFDQILALASAALQASAINTLQPSAIDRDTPDLVSANSLTRESHPNTYDLH
jgi:signal transduction histidine kinase/CheY-like chemotaxis protein